jgi:hypothetical protein
VNYESPAVYPEHVVSGILHLQRCEVPLQKMITSQRISVLESITETMKIPLDSHEDLLWVQERLAIYYNMLERSLLLSHGQHDIDWCQQFTAVSWSFIIDLAKLGHFDEVPPVGPARARARAQPGLGTDGAGRWAGPDCHGGAGVPLRRRPR